jgi:hypothetical protein
MTPHSSTSERSNSLTLFKSSQPETTGMRGLAPRDLSKAMSLFELDESLSLLLDSALEAAEENHSEIPQELQQPLLNYGEAFGEKVDNIARYIHAQEAVIAIAGTEVGRYSRRKARAENAVARLKGLLKFFMDSRQIRSMKGRLNTISLRKNSQDSLLLSDPTSLPTEYCRLSISMNEAEWNDAVQYLPEDHPIRVRFGNPDAVKRESDNSRIRDAIGAGIAVEGAELKRGEHIRVT